MKRFEYKTVQFAADWMFGGGIDKNFEPALNELGREGWELVSCVATNRHQGETRGVHAVFKREVESDLR